MEIGFYGAASTVTGSRYRVSSEKFCALIDCGLFQGYKKLRECNWAELPFEGDTLDAVLFTHAYRDHSGYLPLLIKNGFREPFYCTQTTAALCAIFLLSDSVKRHKSSKHMPALLLYPEKNSAGR